MTRARTDAELIRRGIRLEWATNAWNLLEVVITIWLGVQARSLALVKRSTARALGSETLDAEASLTFLDGCLSSSILLALVLNTVLGWWWTDAVAALIVGGFAIAQGFRNWRNAAPHLDEDPGTAGR